MIFHLIIWTFLGHSHCAAKSQLPNKELSGAKSELQGGTVGVCSSHKRGGQPPYNLPTAHLRFTPRSLHVCLLPNQELSMLYGGPILNYGRQLSLYFLHMLQVNITWDMAHLQLSNLQGEIIPTCRKSELQGERILIRRT